jgi:hypothetical protein
VTTVVLSRGGDGSLLLNDTHPARAIGNSKAIRATRMQRSLFVALDQTWGRPQDFSVQ